jgi:hypothetical protein
MPRDTLPPIWHPLMDAPDITPGYCAVCGRTSPTEKHHPVKRSAGKLFDPKGKERKKPVIELCGFGNNLRDQDGRAYCHGKAHHGLLYFRYRDGSVEYLEVTEAWVRAWEAAHPLKRFGYLESLETEGWMECHGQ